MDRRGKFKRSPDRIEQHRQQLLNKRSRNWRGGRYKNRQGYIVIYRPNHPRCNRHGYVLEHRFVYEEYYKCCLLKWIHIHHINHIRDDNRIENLRPMTKWAHSTLEATKDKSGYKCSKCDSKTTRLNKNGVERWCHIDGKRVCDKCYSKEYNIRNRERLREYMKYYDKYRRKKKNGQK